MPPDVRLVATRRCAMAHQVLTASAVRANPNMATPADFIVTHGSGPIDWLIQAFTRSHWNHAALVVAVDGPAVQIMEMVGSGIHTADLAKYNKPDYHLIHVDSLSDEDRGQVCAYA